MRAIAIQLAKTHDEEVQKFSFSEAIPHKRSFASIRGPLTWLVKSSEKSIRSKSLESFIGRYDPVLSYKLTPKNIGYKESKKTLTLPIYLSGKIFT